MLADFILVGLITLVFSLLACKKSKDFLFRASRSAVMGGLFVSAIKLIVLMSQLEKIADGSAGFSGSISFQSFLIMLFVRFRPLLIGAAFSIIFRIVSGRLRGETSAVQAVQGENDSAQKQLDFSKLSRRETEVANLAARGLTNLQISEELYISPETVKRHIATIFEKLEISSRRELMRK